MTGSPGGSKIPTATAQGLLNLIVDGDELQAAVDRARIHHQWMPETLRFEDGWSSPGTISNLKALGHVVENIDGVGVAQMIGIDEQGVHAASDPRRGGRPAGY